MSNKDGSVIHLTKSNFEEDVLKSEVPVLVDFWAPWCGPCRAVAPILDEVATELGEKAKISKINVDEETELAGNYKIMSIPTMIVFKNGEVAEKMIGLRQKGELIEILNKHM